MFQATFHLPSSLLQTNCIDRQKQDYGEEICKTTGLWKLKQANIVIMLGDGQDGVAGGRGQHRSSNSGCDAGLPQRWWGRRQEDLR